MTILAFSSEENDKHLEPVRSELAKLGHTLKVFDVFEYPKTIQVGYHLSNNHETRASFLLQDGTTIEGKDIKAVWFRKVPNPYINPCEKVYQELHIKQESEAFLETLHHFTPNAYWLSQPDMLRKAYLKPYQLQQALNAGLSIPETCIGNNEKMVSDFIDASEGPYALKASHLAVIEIGSSSKYERILEQQLNIYQSKLAGTLDEEKSSKAVAQITSELLVSYYTQLKDKDFLRGLKNKIANSPLCVQNYIDKAFELRVTVVGDEVFTCAIYSQDNVASVDYRQLLVGEQNLRHEAFELPKDVEEKLLNFMKNMGLDYGAIDRIVTPTGEYVFLEVNPYSKWHYIYKKTKFVIPKAIATQLITKATAL